MQRWADKVPNLVFPAAAVVVFAVLVAFGLSGTSSGVTHEALYGASADDPQLLLGEPRPIRSDEWAVSTAFLIGQDEEGYPAISDRFPGGLDMTLIADLPARDWSTVFRPQLWPFGLVPLESAFAWRWWFLALIVLLASYVLCLQLLPKKAAFAAATAIGLLFAPFVQWWYLTLTLGPLAWSLVWLATLIGLLHATSLVKKAALVLALFYAASAFGLVLYPAFQVPCLVVTAIFTVSLLVFHVRDVGWKAGASVVGGVAAAAGGAAVVAVAFVATRSEAIRAVRGTVYPGARDAASGGFDLARMLQGFSSRSLLEYGDKVVPPALGGNQSEASAFMLVGILVLGAQVWLAVRGRRAGTPASPFVVAVLITWAVFLADLFIYAFDPINEAFLLQLVPLGRLQIGLGLLSVLTIIVLLHDMKRQSVVVSRRAAAFAGVGAAAAVAEVWFRVERIDPTYWPVLSALTVAVVVAAAVYGLLRRRHAAPAMLLACLAVWSGGPVNPLYDGVFDTRTTEIGKTIAAVNNKSPGAWVSTLGALGNVLLIESGVSTYSAISPYPRFETWVDLDPTGKLQDAYNRYAHVNFQWDLPGDVVQSPSADLVNVRLEPCGRFIQRNVKYVLTEGPAPQGCLTHVVDVPVGTRVFTIYEVRSASTVALPGAR